MHASPKPAGHSREQAYLQVEEQGSIRCIWHYLSRDEGERIPRAQWYVGLLQLQARPSI